MFIAYVVLSTLFALVLLFSALGKLRKDPAQMETMRTVGFPVQAVGLLALAETAGAVGLVVGWFWDLAGILAAAGCVAYFLGAVSAHARVRDKNVVPAAVLLLVACAALILRLASQ